MYINERDKIIELLSTVKEAIEYSEMNTEKANFHINECIEALDIIKKYLNEKTSEFNTALIDDIIQLMYNSVEIEDHIAFLKILKQVKKEIVRLQRTIAKLKVRWKAVFLPYKASMWTSLESIWKAAQADPNCDTVVMPIPYYDLDIHGNKTTLQYEGEQFPSYVPITYYKNYNIEEENPEMIFIHNPYDDTNTLTVVEEKYFSRNLKNYTNMLVYSPYYTLRYYNPEKGIQLCVSEATKYSDKILVQSERLKQIYIEHGHKPEKLLALGSPKIDSVVYNVYHPPIIPKQWKEKVEDKYVFLINTHLFYFSKYSVQAFNKIKRIVDYFLEYDDCTIIWRPHPLTEVMLETRFPRHFKLYKQLIGYVEDSNNGIIDRLADYSYAFTVSNAMISTYSSLVTEYMITGKPVYILGKKNDSRLNKLSPVDYSFNYYYEKGKSNVRDFINMVKASEDPFYEERMKMMKRAFLNSTDGSCGQKVYEQLKKELLYRI